MKMTVDWASEIEKDRMVEWHWVRGTERPRQRESGGVENNEQRNQHDQSFDVEMRIFSMK